MSSRDDLPPFSFLNFPWTISSRWGNIIEKQETEHFFMDKYSILKQYYGHSAFRAGQEELIDSILSGRDALCVMPTGGGKSLCYQIPALLLPGITLVVSPLISLMKDQVAALKSAGVPAAYINSSLTGEQIRTVYTRTRKGAYKLIYVAPERLETNSFLSLKTGKMLNSP
jgi:ATP-dependent DNA helicase RecQ